MHRDTPEPEVMRDYLAAMVLLMEKLEIISIEKDYIFNELNDLMFKFLKGVYWNAYQKRIHREEREARDMGHDEEVILNIRLHAHQRATKRFHKSMRELYGYSTQRL